MLAGNLDLVGQVQGIVDSESADDIDIHERDLFGGDRLDIHAAFRGEHDHGTARIHLGVDDDSGVVFLIDIQFFLHQDLFHEKPLDRHAEQGGRRLLRLIGCVGEFDAARLSAPAGPDLNLDHYGLPDLLRDLSSLLGGLCNIPLRDRHLGNLEQRFPFVLM
jgi:hypothetical protein